MSTNNGCRGSVTVEKFQKGGTKGGFCLFFGKSAAKEDFILGSPHGLFPNFVVD